MLFVNKTYYLLTFCVKTANLMLLLPTHTGDGSDSTDPIRDEASLLISEEIERKLISIIEDCFSAASSVKAVGL
jgi:hypothetical protein